MPLNSLNQYVKIQRNDEGCFYAIHFDGVLFLAGHEQNGTPIWSDNLQDSEIHCRESAELLLIDYPGSTADPISVDLHVVV